ncbi:MAG: protein kinase [Bacteroidota bacterium]|jgi:non-specific serine/threonine protein kinase
MIGTTISHYRIIEKIGEGGMGVVYKAEDTKLKRTVALKFLPPELTRDTEAKKRFTHEAQAASTLDHNNICAIYEIGEANDGQLFIAMACYAGDTLKSRIAKGQLEIERAIDLATQIAQGLQQAHEKGIVHRDIKPGNIIITADGVAKILDFGLAKLTGQAKLSRTGSTVGTAAYMSPEQAQGQDVDHRTDIWSLGVVLYEMLTGKLPFRGEHEAALLYSIVHEEPLAISGFRPDIPGNLTSVISKALQKDPRQRYLTARELVSDLKASKAAGIPLPKPEKSIVVLPFDDLSPDRDQEYFSDGLTEEIISDLSNVRALRVISRSSAMTFKGTKKTIPEIARQLTVQYVLEGSVRKAGNSLRITAQLIDAANDAHLWSEKYSGTLDDVFDIQEKVSRAIVAALRLKLSSEEKRNIAERPIDNIRAYECYHKAMAEVDKETADSIRLAIRYLQEAIDVMGDNALLYSAMAYAHLQIVNVGAEHEDFLRKAEEFAKKALSLDPESAKARAELGWIAMWANPREAYGHLKKAFAISPDDTHVLRGLLIFFIQEVGKIDAAIPLCEKLVRLDPLDFGTKWLQGGIHFYNGQYNLALSPFRASLDVSPENPICRFYYALTLASLGHYDDAISIVDQAPNATDVNAFARLGRILKYSLRKDREKAFEELSSDLLDTCRRDCTFSHHLAGIFALLGERNEALNWLENAYDRGFINYPLLSERDPLLANIRGEERFKKLMERVKYEWEHFEV